MIYDPSNTNSENWYSIKIVFVSALTNRVAYLKMLTALHPYAMYVCSYPVSKLKSNIQENVYKIFFVNVLVFQLFLKCILMIFTNDFRNVPDI